MKQKYYDSRYRIILLGTYIENLSEYSFGTIKLIENNGSILEEIRKDFMFDFSNYLQKTGKNALTKQQQLDELLKYESSNYYFFIDQNSFSEEFYWPDSQKIEFLLELVHILDYADDKFLLFKKLYETKATFFVKIHNSLRNIGMFPYNEEDRLKFLRFKRDLDTQYFFKSYLKI